MSDFSCKSSDWYFRTRLFVVTNLLKHWKLNFWMIKIYLWYGYCKVIFFFKIVSHQNVLNKEHKYLNKALVGYSECACAVSVVQHDWVTTNNDLYLWGPGCYPLATCGHWAWFLVQWRNWIFNIDLKLK